MKTEYALIPVYETKDGSQIRELMHPDRHGNHNQSLAEATVKAGQTTALHKHIRSEEIYHIRAGNGVMTLGDQVFTVAAGDTIAIAPGIPHKISNTGKDPLLILCSCSPPYSHDDTQLVSDS